MARLESMRSVQPHLDAIDRLESEGDAVYRRILARLFGGEFDALEVLRWKDVIEAMEGAIEHDRRTSPTSSSRSSSSTRDLTAWTRPIAPWSSSSWSRALGFDFVNGFHDAANSIATVVSTRVLSPRWR